MPNIYQRVFFATFVLCVAPGHFLFIMLGIHNGYHNGYHNDYQYLDSYFESKKKNIIAIYLFLICSIRCITTNNLLSVVEISVGILTYLCHILINFLPRSIFLPTLNMPFGINLKFSVFFLAPQKK